MAGVRDSLAGEENPTKLDMDHEECQMLYLCFISNMEDILKIYLLLIKTINAHEIKISAYRWWEKNKSYLPCIIHPYFHFKEAQHFLLY